MLCRINAVFNILLINTCCFHIGIEEFAFMVKSCLKRNLPTFNLLYCCIIILLPTTFFLAAYEQPQKTTNICHNIVGFVNSSLIQNNRFFTIYQLKV